MRGNCQKGSAARAAPGRVQSPRRNLTVSGGSERYCARGEECTQYAVLGKPQKLRNSSAGTICARCEEAGQTPENSTSTVNQVDEDKKRANKRAVSADTQSKVRRFKNALVVQLWVKDGAFWESIRNTRNRWKITARYQLPPSGPGIGGLIAPERAPDGELEGLELLDQWLESLKSIEDQFIPARLKDAAEWDAFISACVLCDPPEEELIKFAEHGDPCDPFMISARTENRENDKLPLQAAAPVRWLCEESELENVCFSLFNRLLEELGERHLIPLGLDVEALVENVFDSTDLRTEFQEKKKALKRRYYIGVEEGVSKEDVGRAFDRIPTLHKARLRGGAPRRDPLVALQCALLYDHYNGRDHQDRRRKKWTYGFAPSPRTVCL